MMKNMLMGTKEDLEKIFEIMKEQSTIIGPKLSVDEYSIRYEEINHSYEIACGIEDIQEPGKYMLMKGENFRHGFDSPKKYLFPSTLKILRIYKGLKIEPYLYGEKKLTFFAIKPCDAAAVKIIDKTFTSNNDKYYKTLKNNLTIIVENCTKPGHTCFCSTMKTGPRVKDNFDIAYTKVENKILFEAGSNKGKYILERLQLKDVSKEVMEKFLEIMTQAYEKARSKFEIENLPEKLEEKINDEDLWKKVSEKCVGCGNCTMVCPTCFCFDIYDESNLDEYVDRIRYWDSCFTYRYAEVAGGHFRPELWARYRQWLLHKFSYWKKQFDIIGCVGCGRCITWCPMGIDIRKNVLKILEGE